MTTATNHWKLGLFVVAAILAMLGTLFWVGARRFHRDSFQAVSYFDESVQGLDVGSPVKFRGVTVGTVADITIAPDHRLVQITSDIYLDALIRLGLLQSAPKVGEQFIDPHLRVQLTSAGITGVKFLQTDFFDERRYPPPSLPFPAPWNYVPSAPSTLKSIEEAAVDILNRFPQVETGIIDAAADLRKTLDSVGQLSGKLAADDGTFNTLLVQLRSSAARLDTALTDAKLGPTTESFRESAGSVGRAVADVADVRHELREALVALRETLESIRALADAVERDPSVLVRGMRADQPGERTQR
ncbi:MAG TPA: MlaD family protein [Candidatus Binatia bacterium]|jgi:ABC-type transporter Mla subunit MlaD